MSDEKKQLTYLEQFNANYNGLSEQANDLQNYTKDNGKNAVYIPWAVMERMTRQQDPSFIADAVPTDDGGLVHTQVFNLETVSAVKNKDGVTEMVTTKTMVLSHMVQIFASFMGMNVTEHYPIQNTGDYSATKAYDQNSVNKAVLRGKAKALSRLTGIGLKLYERHDLQFIDDGAKLDGTSVSPAIADKNVPKTESATATPITRRKNATTPPVTEASAPISDAPNTIPVQEQTTPVEAKPVSEDVKIISDLLLSYNDTDERKALAVRFLRSYNNAFMKQFGFTVTMDETNDELCEKLGKMPDPSKFLAAARARGL